MHEKHVYSYAKRKKKKQFKKWSFGGGDYSQQKETLAPNDH